MAQYLHLFLRLHRLPFFVYNVIFHWSSSNIFSPAKFDNEGNIHYELEIRDHSIQPFKQYTTYFTKENFTEIIVEAHNDYEENTFYLLPEYQLRITVIGNHTCIFADIHAYDFNDTTESELISTLLFITELNDSENVRPDLLSGIVNRQNVKKIEIESSFKQSDIAIDFLPRRVVEKCQEKNTLELEFIRLRDESFSGEFLLIDL